MKTRKYQFHDGARGAALAVRVIPRARKDEIVGIMADGTLKIRLKAPPVDGKANQALVRFMARVLQVPKSQVELVAGHTRRHKLVAVLGLDLDQVQARLAEHLP